MAEILVYSIYSANEKAAGGGPNPPAPFPEREGGDMRSPFRGGAGGGEPGNKGRPRTEMYL